MTARNSMEGISALNPFECRMWDGHDRLQDFLNEESCRDVIESFLKEGQKLPVLARPRREQDGFKYELIYGARRLFSARHLNVKLLARVREMDDRMAFVEMDIENRLRRDISPYERGMSFRSWLREGYFRSQEEIARTLGLSPAQVSRLLRFSELPTSVITAFPDPRQIKEAWAVALAERCADSKARKAVLATARALQRQGRPRLDAKQIYKLLLEGRPEPARSRIATRDEIVRTPEGRPLFRVSYRHNELHIVMRRDIAPPSVVGELARAIKNVLKPNPARTRDAREPPPSRTASRK